MIQSINACSLNGCGFLYIKCFFGGKGRGEEPFLTLKSARQACLHRISLVTDRWSTESTEHMLDTMAPKCHLHFLHRQKTNLCPDLPEKECSSERNVLWHIYMSPHINSLSSECYQIPYKLVQCLELKHDEKHECIFCCFCGDFTSPTTHFSVVTLAWALSEST